MNLHNLEEVKPSCWIDERYNIDYENVLHLNVRLLVLVLGHLQIKLRTLITFAYGIQIRHILVCQNPMLFVNQLYLETCDLIILSVLNT